MQGLPDAKAKEVMETLVKVVDELAGPGVYVITDDSMTREERYGRLYRGFLAEGHTPERAGEKAREFLELAELAGRRSFNA